MSSTVEQIKERLNIADVIGSYIKLEKAGGNFKARCPFHNEKTPSFFVSPSRQSYHCFGCNQGGDMLSFVQEIEGVDFLGALRILADRAGVEIKREQKGLLPEKEKLFDVLEDATTFFERNLKGAKDVIEYLKKRGLTGETAKRFRIGYALSGWTALYDFLKEKGYSDTIIEKAGLIIKGERGYYDRFRSRITFPLADSSGRIVGFSGRIFGAEDEKTAKYVNSPETELYNKSKILYGFDKAKIAIRKEGFCVLVEGQMDLLMSHQAGVINTVAVSGTALTEHHLGLIRRMADRLVFAFDPDDAGLSASRRGIDLALSLGLDVAIADLSDGLDPADLILKDEKKWAEQVKNAQHIIDFSIRALADKGLDQRTFRIKVGEMVLPYVARLQNRINQAHFVTEIARKLGISEAPIWEELGKISKEKDRESEPREARVEGGGRNAPQRVSRREMIERKVLGLIFLREEDKERAEEAFNARRRYRDIVGEEGIKKDAALTEGEKKEYMFEAEVYYGDTGDIEKEITQLMRYLEEEVLKERFDQMMSALRDAENKEDIARAAELLKQCQDISKRINELK